MAFKKTYYSNQDIAASLDTDLDWIEKTHTGFEISIYESDLETAQQKIIALADSMGLKLTVSNPDPILTGNRLVIFTARKT